MVNVWSVESKSLLSTCTGHTYTVDTLAVMPDGKRILSGAGGRDKTVRVWDLDGTLVHTLQCGYKFSNLHVVVDDDMYKAIHTDEVTSLVALPDNQHALVGVGNGIVKLLNANAGTTVCTFTHLHMLRCLALMPDGRRIVGLADHAHGYGLDCIIAEHGLDPRLAASPAV